MWKLIFSVQDGALPVMITLTSTMQMLSASFWDSLVPQLHMAMHTLEQEVGLSHLIILTVLSLKQHHFTAPIVVLEFITASTMKMLVFNAHVSHVKLTVYIT